VAVAAALAVAAAGTTASAAATTRSASPPFRYAWILKASKRMGTPMPSTAFWVASRRQEAVRVTSGDWVNSDQPVYVVEITGHFTARDVSVPVGAKSPTGTVATFVIARATDSGLDFGLTTRRSALGKLGHVNDLLPWLRRLARRR
jgi:hypothetical protein